jgi:hypothetical protein
VRWGWERELLPLGPPFFFCPRADIEFADTYVDFDEKLAWARSHPAECESMVKAMRAEWLRTFGTWEPAIQATIDGLKHFGWEATPPPAEAAAQVAAAAAAATPTL